MCSVGTPQEIRDFTLIDCKDTTWSKDSWITAKPTWTDEVETLEDISHSPMSSSFSDDATSQSSATDSLWDAHWQATWDDTTVMESRWEYCWDTKPSWDLDLDEEICRFQEKQALVASDDVHVSLPPQICHDWWFRKCPRYPCSHRHEWPNKGAYASMVRSSTSEGS